MRFIIKRKSGATGTSDLDSLSQMPGVEFVDRIGDQAALIEASQEAVERLAVTLPDWTVAPEAGIARPTPPYPRGKWKLD